MLTSPFGSKLTTDLVRTDKIGSQCAQYTAQVSILLSAVIVQINGVWHNDRSMDNLMPDTKASLCFVHSFLHTGLCYLFLYPCFRTAAIGTAHVRLIYERLWEIVAHFRPDSSSASLHRTLHSDCHFSLAISLYSDHCVCSCHI